MTSRVSFYKVMREDMRHKTWMLALSCLASFLAMPVLFLLLESAEWEHRIEYILQTTSKIEAYKIECVQLFFGEVLPITAGIVLVVGALIVGLFGFCHVFSKKMTDLYQSLPIRKRDLFFAQYVNGFLIWFIPMFLCAVLCAIFAAVFLGNGENWLLYVVKPLWNGIGSYLLSFLIVYHVVILAVMLSGNILNTLINGTILNFFVLFGYMMLESFHCYFFDTHYSMFEEQILKLLWTSPIASSVYQLVLFATESVGVSVVGKHLFVIIVLFFAGFYLYVKRPSELAEQGMKYQTLQVIWKTGMTIWCGMAGWLLFTSITDTLAWQIFGAVLAGILCYGTLDMIFHMDFKAFFAHKISLCISVACSILIGFYFTFDWGGYDTYLPKQSEIKEIGICIDGIGITWNGDAYDGVLTTKYRLDHMSYADPEVAYALLKEMTTEENRPKQDGYSASIYVKVTQNNGKTYYRQYRIFDYEEDLVTPILLDESYIKSNVWIPQAVIDGVSEAGIQKSLYLEGGYSMDTIEEEQIIRELMEAYNQDMLEHPNLFIYQNDKNLVSFRYRNSSPYMYLYFDCYESMEHMQAVLEKYDIQLYKIKAEDVENITILSYVKEKDALQEVFGFIDSDQDTMQTETVEEASTWEFIEGYQAVFTEMEDITELLELISICEPNYHTLWSSYRMYQVEVRVNLKNEESYYGTILKGTMPQKFLDQMVLGGLE